MAAYDYLTPDTEYWIDSTNTGGDGSEFDPFTDLTEAITAGLGSDSADDIITFWLKNGLDDNGSTRYNLSSSWASGVILQIRAYAGQEAAGKDQGAGLTSTNTSSWLNYTECRFYDIRFNQPSEGHDWQVAASVDMVWLNCYADGAIGGKWAGDDGDKRWFVNSVCSSTNNTIFDNVGRTTPSVNPTTYFINSHLAGRSVTRSYNSYVCENTNFTASAFLASYTGDSVVCDNCNFFESSPSHIDTNNSANVGVDYTDYFVDEGAGDFTPTADATLIIGEGDSTLTNVPSLDANGVTRDTACETGPFEFASGHDDLVADSGTFSLTGQSVTFTKNSGISLVQGAFVLAGQDVNLLLGKTIILAVGSFTLTGQDILFLNDKNISAEFGSFSLAGSSVGLLKHPVIGFDNGSFSVVGQDQILIANNLLQASQGSFSVNGQDVGLMSGLEIALEYGEFSLAGSSIELLRHRKVDFEFGAFNLNGQDVGFDLQNLLNLDNGSFSVAGQQVNFAVGRVVAFANGSFTLTGQAINFSLDKVVEFDNGTFSLNGQDVDFKPASLITADYGSFTLTGQSADLLIANVLQVDNGSFTLTGYDVLFSVGDYVTSDMSLRRKVVFSPRVESIIFNDTTESILFNDKGIEVKI